MNVIIESFEKHRNWNSLKNRLKYLQNMNLLSLYL